MLGKRLVTQQTGPEGLPVERVYVESGSDIEREIYLSLTLNRERGRIALIASAAGGMDIEEVAHKTPGEDPRGQHSSGGGLAALPGAPARVRPGAERRADRRVPVDRDGALPALYREGREPASRSIR